MDEKKILNTKDYGMFKILKGNREVAKERVYKIKKSILDVGYITSPILVNENMEVIDGQGRLQALKELEMPVEYIVQNGLTIKECISMNINQTNWKLLDYIKSYADRGLKNYEILLQLINKYEKIKSLDIFATAINHFSRFDKNMIQNGTLKIDEDMYEDACRKLDYVYDFTEVEELGPKNLIMQGMLFVLILNDEYNIKIQTDFLKQRILESAKLNKIPNFATVSDVIEWFEKTYNYNRKINYVFIYTYYREFSMKKLRKTAEYAQFMRFTKKRNEIEKEVEE